MAVTSQPAMDVENGENSAEEELRRQELRKAGQEYFNRILEKAIRGEDAFAQRQAPGANSPRRRQSFGTIEDPDLVAFGYVFEGSKLYFLMGLFAVCQGSCFVCLKGSLILMPTPAVQSFLHMAAVTLATWILSAHDIIDKPTFTLNAIKSCSVCAALNGLQTLAAFGALLNGSVYLVLSWIFALPALMELLCLKQFQKVSIQAAWVIAVAVSLCAAALELASDHHRNFHTAFMILLWAVARAGEYLWQQLKADATLGNRIKDVAMVQRIQELASLEQEQSYSSLLFFQHALPAVPALVVGLLCFEGTELVVHEPSVPGLTVLLMSCLMYSSAALCHNQLAPKLGPRLTVLLQGAAGGGSIVLDFLERAHELSFLALAGAIVAVGSATAAGFQRASVKFGGSNLAGTAYRPVG